MSICLFLSIRVILFLLCYGVVVLLYVVWGMAIILIFGVLYSSAIYFYFESGVMWLYSTILWHLVLCWFVLLNLVLQYPCLRWFPILCCFMTHLYILWYLEQYYVMLCHVLSPCDVWCLYLLCCFGFVFNSVFGGAVLYFFIARCIIMFTLV